MGTLNVANLNHTGNTFTTSANLNLGGSWVDAPVGTIIKRGSYNTGSGANARTTMSSTSYTTVNINGTNQVGMNIGKHSDDIITFSKISNKSHLEIAVKFPYYVTPGDSGFALRCQASHNSGSSYHTLGNLDNGPAHTWGSGGYGGNDAGIYTYTWSTYDRSTERSSWLAKTGEVRFYFEMRTHSADTIYFIDYNDLFPKEGTIQISEIIVA